MPFYTIKWVQNICSHVDLRRTEFPLWWCARFAKIAGKVLRGSQFLRLAYFASQCFIFIGKPFLQSQGNTFENWHFHDSMKTVVNVCCHQHLFAGGFYRFLNLWVAYSRNVFYSHPLFFLCGGGPRMQLHSPVDDCFGSQNHVKLLRVSGMIIQPPPREPKYLRALLQTHRASREEQWRRLVQLDTRLNWSENMFKRG